ncbi:M6 family metalloprotease domain-containing protein [Bacterioplanoides sp.]|uniref:M6 family metalloprotease domain-containing protein n=1 Tax=Bacterioplanoides sp. TaxID=2066072 RepID=UPI003B5C8CF2
MFRLISYIVIFFLAEAASANVLPLQQPFTLTLSDGSQIQVTPAGNRDNHWLETADGKKILQRGDVWFIADVNNHGVVTATDQPLVDGLDVSHIIEMTEFHQHEVGEFTVHSREALSVVTAQNQQTETRTPYRYPGGWQYFRQNLLVIRVAFADQGFRYSDAEVARSLFGESDSVNHYFLENSYGNFDVQPVNENVGTANDGIVSITLPGKHPDFGSAYGSASQNLAREALERLPETLNLAAYDKNGDNWLDPNELGVVFLVSGYEQAFAGAGTTRPRIWAHKSSLYRGQYQGLNIGEYAMFGERHQTRQATIGIICHELGHLLFDLPDLYDRYGKSMGIGRWGLMGLGGWNSASGTAGNSPAHMLGWSKEQAGFISLGQVKEGMNNITMRAVTDGPDVLEVNLDGYRHGQRILLEHRRQHNYDLGLPGEGVLVTRIDDWVGYGPLGNQNDDVSRQLVNVEEADGGSDLDQNRNRGDANDVFRSASGQTLFSAVSPSPAANELPNVVELLEMETGVVADVSLNVSNPVFGDNLGYDDVGPNAAWGKYDGVAQVLIELSLNDNVVWMDGIDWFALGEGRVDVEIFPHDPQLSGYQGALWKEAGFPVVSGWNRLMFKQRLQNQNYSQVFVLLTSRAEANHQPLAIDLQGRLSEKTWVREGTSDNFGAAEFDVAARLLVMNRDIPAAPFLNRGDVSRSEGESSSGAGMLSLLLLFVLVPRRRRV